MQGGKTATDVRRAQGPAQAADSIGCRLSIKEHEGTYRNCMEQSYTGIV